MHLDGVGGLGKNGAGAVFHYLILQAAAGRGPVRTGIGCRRRFRGCRGGGGRHGDGGFFAATNQTEGGREGEEEMDFHMNKSARQLARQIVCGQVAALEKPLTRHNCHGHGPRLRRPTTSESLRPTRPDSLREVWNIQTIPVPAPSRNFSDLAATRQIPRRFSGTL